MPEYLKSAEPSTGDVARDVESTVREILDAVQLEGEAAVRRWSKQLDDWDPPDFEVGPAAIERAAGQVPAPLKEDIGFALDQIRSFAARQRATLTDLDFESLPGVRLGHRHIPVASVGSYSPGGRYPLIASALMTIAVPKAAGVDRVVACAPPRDDGGIHPAQLYAMHVAGADQIYCFGGVQALAALAYGVAGPDPVDMIVGAGNAYVAEAKRQLFGVTGIDLLAGPTEILVIADEQADPDLVAIDLLGQAEHGVTSPAVLVTWSRELGERVLDRIEHWLGDWPTAEITEQAWRTHGEVILCADANEAVSLADDLAPEHLEVQTADPGWFQERLRNYGSLFLGPLATVAFGDKAIGVNHVLPTGRAARYTGGLWVGKFLKTCTYQEVAPEGLAPVAKATAGICDAEFMAGHALTARYRLGLVRAPVGAGDA